MYPKQPQQSRRPCHVCNLMLVKAPLYIDQSCLVQDVWKQGSWRCQACAVALRHSRPSKFAYRQPLSSRLFEKESQNPTTSSGQQAHASMPHQKSPPACSSPDLKSKCTLSGPQLKHSPPLASYPSVSHILALDSTHSGSHRDHLVHQIMPAPPEPTPRQ